MKKSLLSRGKHSGNEEKISQTLFSPRPRLPMAWLVYWRAGLRCDFIPLPNVTEFFYLKERA